MEPLARITPLESPTCPACGIVMEVFTDASTGRKVCTGGRAMMRCPECGEVTVSHDPVQDRRRVRRFNFFATIVFAIGVFVTVLYQLLKLYAQNTSGPPPQWWVMACIVVFLPSATFYLTLRQFMIAIHPRDKEYVIERWVSALLMLGLTVVTMWAILEAMWRSYGGHLGRP